MRQRWLRIRPLALPLLVVFGVHLLGALAGLAVALLGCGCERELWFCVVWLCALWCAPNSGCRHRCRSITLRVCVRACVCACVCVCECV